MKHAARKSRRLSIVAPVTAPMSSVELASEGNVTVKEAMALLGVKRTKLNELIKNGDIVSGRIGGRRTISRKSLMIYNAAHYVRQDRAS